MTDIVETVNLTKIFNGTIRAVDDVSFSVEEGEIFGFLGPNGAGKTTTILILITLLKPTSGKATVCGYDVVKNPREVRESLGYVSQEIAVDDRLTGRENIQLQGHFYHLPKGVLEERVNEALEMVDLADRADDLVETYSGGMRKRLDIAEGLIHRPRVLFLDEPTLGLDVQTRHKIWEYIRRLREEANVTIFLTTHYMEEADQLCDRVAIIDYGQIKALGKPSELKSQIGGDVITIKFTQATKHLAEKALARISKLRFVEKIVPAKDSYNVIAKNGDVVMPKVFEAAAETGAAIDSISLKRPNLDEVFLTYTGRALREEEGGREAFWRKRIALRRARR